MSGVLSGNVSLWVGGLAVSAAVVVGGIVYVTRTAPPEQRPVAQETALPAPTAAPQVAETEPKLEPEAPVQAEATEPERARPSLQEVRLEPDGLAVIAGRAAPLAEVILRVDGVELARAIADGAGAFAAVAQMGTARTARVLTVAEVTADGTEWAALDEMILAPAFPPAPQVAASQETPAPATIMPPDDPTQLAALRPEEEVQVTDAPNLDAPAPVVATPEATGPEPAPTPAPTVVGVADPTEPDPADPAPQAVAPVVALSQAPTAPAAPSAVTPSAQTQQDAATAALETSPAPTTLPVAVLRSSAAGVEVVRPASPSPQVMQQVALDTITYSAKGDVRLTGRAQDSARAVRVYLDNAVVTSLEVGPGGDWRGELPDIRTGVYTLRLDEVDETGRVTSRVETPFKREDPAVLTAATTDPAAPVSAVTVQAGATLWAIARERYGQGTLYLRVFEANRDLIRDPDLIYPGQVFSLPGP